MKQMSKRIRQLMKTLEKNVQTSPKKRTSEIGVQINITNESDDDFVGETSWMAASDAMCKNALIDSTQENAHYFMSLGHSASINLAFCSQSSCMCIACDHVLVVC